MPLSAEPPRPPRMMCHASRCMAPLVLAGQLKSKRPPCPPSILPALSGEVFLPACTAVAALPEPGCTCKGLPTLAHPDPASLKADAACTMPIVNFPKYSDNCVRAAPVKAVLALAAGAVNLADRSFVAKKVDEVVMTYIGETLNETLDSAMTEESPEKLLGAQLAMTGFALAAVIKVGCLRLNSNLQHPTA